MKKKSLLGLFLILLVGGLNAQTVDGFRLNGRVGFGIPIGDFAATGIENKKSGLASAGLDFNGGLEIFFTDVIDLGVKMGYSVYPVNESGLEDIYLESWGFVPEVNTTSYQNIYFLGGTGLNFSVIEDKFDVQPYFYAGLGIFKSARKEAFGINDGVQYNFDNESNYQPGLHLQPGLSLNFYLNDFVEFQAFGEYNHLDVNVEETIGENNSLVRTNQDIQYTLSGIHIGGGLTFRF